MKKTTFSLNSILFNGLTPTTLGLITLLTASPSVQAGTFTFTPIVNNADQIPNTDRFFSSYNQPSVNGKGLVVFRARSAGGQGQPATGIFTRNMDNLLNPSAIIPIAMRNDELVPDPNHTGATFNEFPAFPRIDRYSAFLAFRGQSEPVWELADGTRVGTSGIYATPTSSLMTGMSQLGNLPDFSNFAVPNTASNTRFEQFPGAPSPTNDNILIFKGNWTDEMGNSQTGVYFRNLLALSGESPVQLIADSNTLIPNNTEGITFGSTAPPSSAKGKAVFVGVDQEENPTAGGIYLSALFNNPTALTPLVSIGGLADFLGDETGLGLTHIGEGLSFDGQSVAFWGAWGTETFTQIVSCPEEGNAVRLQFCLEQSNTLPNGLENGNFQFEIPKNQGIFVIDTKTLLPRLIAQTGDQFITFLYWNFSGRAPSEESSEEGLELARWRSSAFIAVDGGQTVFKGTRGTAIESGIEGIYAQLKQNAPLMTVLEQGMDGFLLDAEATGLPITTLGLERDGLRNGWLALTASMGDEEANWGGIYVTRTAVPESSTRLGLLGIGLLGLGQFIRQKRIKD